jgi:hypothetical protein
LLVHIGDPSSNQATSLESQVIHMIQELFGQTLRPPMSAPKSRAAFASTLRSSLPDELNTALDDTGGERTSRASSDQSHSECAAGPR